MNEAKLTHAIISALNKIPGVYVWRQNTGAAKISGRFVRFGKVGQADITGVMIGGRRVDIEVKIKHKITPEQDHFLTEMRERGGLSIIVTSVGEAVDFVTQSIKDYKDATRKTTKT